jgi:hypothetical protein
MRSQRVMDLELASKRAIVTGGGGTLGVIFP